MGTGLLPGKPLAMCMCLPGGGAPGEGSSEPVFWLTRTCAQEACKTWLHWPCSIRLAACWACGVVCRVKALARQYLLSAQAALVQKQQLSKVASDASASQVVYRDQQRTCQRLSC